MRPFLISLASLCLYAQNIDYVRQVKSKPVTDTRQFNFLFSVPQQLSGSLLGAGSHTLTFTPCPFGTGGSDAFHYLRVGGSGTPETVLITGGTCTSGAATGTLTFTTANSHPYTGSAPYPTVGSATGGLQEATYALATPPGEIKMPAGSLTVYAPVYVPSLSNSTNGVIHYEGAGMYSTQILVDTSFPVSATQGVFTVQATNYPSAGPIFSDFKISFNQPNSTDRTTYSQWNAFYLKNVNRPQWINVAIDEAWNGIDLRGDNLNSGTQAVFENVHFGTFNRCVMFDGATDNIKMSKIHWWNFDFALVNNKNTAFSNSLNICIETGRLDGLNLSDSIFVGPVAIRSYTSAYGATNALVSNTFFDTQALTKIESGIWHFGNDWWSTAADNTFYNNTSAAITVTGGEVTVTGARLQPFTSGGTIIMPALVDLNYILGTQGNNQFTLSNSTFYGQNIDIPLIRANAATSMAGVINLNGNIVNRGGIAFTTPAITISATSGGSLNANIEGTKFINTGGTGVGIKILADDSNNRNRVLGNDLAGMTMSLPTSKIFGIYQDDSNQNYYSNEFRNFSSPISLLTISGGTISPLAPFVFVNGTGLTTITVPNGAMQTCIYINPASAFTYATGGNLATSGTATINKLITACYETSNAKWYLSN